MNQTASCLLAALTLGTILTPFATAQDPAALAANLLVPLHHEAADQGSETWAAGPAYKASFHDGFVFYPLLGKAAPRNLPWRFTTTAAITATAGIAGAGPRGQAEGAWRYGYTHHGVREIYDVRHDGVEQSFLIEARPAGDLTIRGRIDSELRCAAVNAAHQALTFCDADGNPRVRYGEAFAIDAEGDKLAITTAWDGREVSLHVPAAWLAQARFPVLVDPLTSVVTLQSQLSQVIDTCDIGHQSETTAGTLLVAMTRWASASDRDLYALTCDIDFANRTTVLSQVTTTYDDHDPSVAFVAGANRWVVSAIRGGAILRTYFHDRGNTALNSGVFDEETYAFFILRTLDVGGTYSGTTGVYALCAYSAEPTGGQPIQAGLLRLDAQNRVSDLSFAIGGTPVSQWHSEQPRVNQVSNNSAGNNDGWLVVWQQRNILTTDDWDLMAVRTSFNATSISAPVTLVNGGSVHVTQPRVSGGTGYYLLTYLESQDLNSPAGARLVGRRVLWPNGQSTFSQLGPTNTLAIALPPLTTLTNHEVAQNHEISSTGLAVYTSTRRSGLPIVTTLSAHATRLTTGGAAVATETLYATSGQSAISPTVTFALPSQSYPLAYGTDQASLLRFPLFGRRFTYPADAIEALYGAGCGPLAIGGHRPYLGNGHYQVAGVTGPTFVPTALLVGATSAATPLDPIGMLGCMLNVQTAFSLPGATDATGLTVFAVPLPETLLVAYDLFFQIAYVNPGSNSLGVQATRGLRAQVR